MLWLPTFLIGVSVSWYFIRAGELFARKEKSRLHSLLGFIFLWWGASTLKDLVLYTHLAGTAHMLTHVYYLDGCGAVTFALLLFELTMPGWVTFRRFLLLLLPFAVFLLLHVFITDAWLRRLYTVFFVAFAWTAVIVAFVKERLYSKIIRQNYSNLEDVDITWPLAIIIIFIVCQHVWWLTSESSSWIYDSVYYAASLMCWHLTLRGVFRLRLQRFEPPQQTRSADSELRSSEHPLELVRLLPKQERSSRSPEARRAGGLAGRLEALMDSERLYLVPDLTLADLTTRLGTNRTYLSEYFSTQLNVTFYDYVNRLRVERSVIPLMKRAGDLSLDQIARQSGFKSTATFRRAFKKFTGILPSEYMQHVGD